MIRDIYLVGLSTASLGMMIGLFFLMSDIGKLVFVMDRDWETTP